MNFFQSPVPPLINLEDHGVFNAGGSVFFRVGKQTLVCNSKAGVLQMFDSDWRPTYRYDRTGPGPEELERPVVLGVTTQKIVVISHGQTVMVFDDRLRLLPEMPRISRGGHFIRFGMNVSENRFRVFPMPTPEHIVYDLELNGDSWVKKEFIATNPQSAISTSLSVQGANAFIDETPSRQFADLANFKNSDSYRIEVHHFGKSLAKNLVQVLGHSTVGLEGHKGYVRMIGNSFQNDQGYNVHVAFIRYPNYHRISYLDTYASDGEFASRQKIDPKWIFAPSLALKKPSRLTKMGRWSITSICEPGLNRPVIGRRRA